MIRAIAVAGLCASFAAGAADIQKCADASGNITYQDAACPRGSAIGSVPRESAQGDPVAIRQLEREKARIAREADLQRAAELQQQNPPVIIQQFPQQGIAGGTVGAAGPTFTGPVNIVDPSTGAVIVPGVNAVVDPNTGTVISLGTNAAPQSVQPGTSATPSATQPSAITQPPTAAPAAITQVPAGSRPNVQIATPSPGTTAAPAVGAPR